MTSNSYVIAVDLGGTNLRVGAVREDGSIEFRERQDSDSRSGSRNVLSKIAQLVRSVAEKAQKKGAIQGVSLGFPGIVDPQKGIVYRSPHFPDWKDLEISSYFQKELPWPVVVDNDANLAALGEHWKGAGQGLKNFVMLTFGTGVGGGIILNGSIHHGDRGFAGEIGHICIQHDGPECACGSRGCLETFVSGSGILRLVEDSKQVDGREQLLQRFGRPLERLTVKDLYEAALDGDIFANSIFKKMGYYLGIGIAALTNTLGVETFVLGGGVAQAWDFFIEAAKRELAERTYDEVAKNVQIKKTILGDDAGLLGGTRVVFTQGN